MSSTLRLTEAERDLVVDILRTCLPTKHYQVWVFGSRAGGNPRSNSDLDLLFEPPLDLGVRSELQEHFDESGLAFEVDLVNRADLADAYRAQIEAKKILLSHD